MSALDIPDHVYQNAILKYEDVATWLAEDGSELQEYEPEIYPQGSFRLGTVVRPISKDDEYDIDLVCHLSIAKERTTQEKLKNMIGDRLEKRDDLRKMLSPSRRCWVLEYPPEAQISRFHMDILPAIPDRQHPPTGIAITDTELTRWQQSNPKAYSKWFFDRMDVVFRDMRASLAAASQAAVEDVPEWQVKTPLQVAVQVLKRHRDIAFQDDPDNRPASIIITTLAALAYRNQSDTYDAFIDIVRDMPGFIKKRDGIWWVANPVDSAENFADRWNEHPERQEAFTKWLQKVSSDFATAGQKQTLEEAKSFLVSSFDPLVEARLSHDYGIRQESSPALTAPSLLKVPELADASHALPPQRPVQLQWNANVSASVHKEKGTKRMWRLGANPQIKGVSLRFEVHTDTPQPYDVSWQVVNTGNEAASNLRGGFYPGDDLEGRVRWESTRYSGIHWVEAFIIKDEICVARSGRKYVKIW